MGKISVSRFIAAPPKRVFEIATDFERVVERITSIRSMEVLTGGEIRKGTQFRMSRRALGQETHAEVTVAAVDAPKSYQVGCTCDGFRYDARLRFEPDGSGTNFVLELAWTPLTLTAKLMAPLTDGKIRKCVKACDQDLDELKYAAEQPVAKAA